MNTLLIIKGISGSGKSTLAKFIAKQTIDGADDVAICEADSYFYNHKGEYNFDSSKLQAAHASCFKNFSEAIDNQISLIIVSNTSCNKWEGEKYIKKAKEAGYKVFSIIVENINKTKSVHNVPNDVLIKQKKNLANSFLENLE